MKLILKDKDKEYESVAIIETKTSTAKDVQEAIYKVAQIYDYNSDDLEYGLPDDCVIHWFNQEIDGVVEW